MAALLAAVGGFLDAFTYFGHGRVFANAMSGNVVLLGAFAASRQWTQALRHVLPIAAFLFGVAAAQLPRLRAIRESVPDPALTSLAAELGFLVAAGWYPNHLPDYPLVLGLSFVAALQSSSFARVHNWSYSSTVTTGNLRHFGETAFKAIFQRPDPEAMDQTLVFGAVCLAFLAGATVGGVCVRKMQNMSLWVASIPLSIAAILLLRDRSHSARGGDHCRANHHTRRNNRQGAHAERCSNTI
jgi:uncharacterized membrane protein YoaK (UPF0700 family)